MATYTASGLKTVVNVTSKASFFTGCTLINLDTVPGFLHVFDTAGVVTLGTTLAKVVIPISANATAANGSAIVVSLPKEDWVNISSGTMQLAATTAVNGNTALTTGLSGTIYFNGSL